MSRIGKQPITVPDGVEITISDKVVIAKNSKGELTLMLNSYVKVEQKDKEIIVSIKDENNKKQKAFWGLTRTLIFNMIEGLTKGFEKTLEVNGVGYKVALAGNKLTLNVGYSQPVDFEIPQGLTAKVEGNKITLSGTDKQLVGQTAAKIRKVRKPEPYKGKGIKYIDEIIRRKAGKAAKASE
ncbi:50S ribosomal protein L6 [Candidatus Falkowbacteria bacterium]|jgi:large subunit ribosomal protein L6|nr:50S ribosomal protein L6 [Candidatus Falkowbacteria bacterium]MBT4433009.1 50S ribosomal protein L6 [Candidatus Falkowbacteria bacterium]